LSEVPPAVRMRGITRCFDRHLALDGVDFDLRPGEIHALLGENGAGKSTLMHLLSGLLEPDAGSIEVAGGAVRFRTAADAARAGIGMVHQHFRLVENLTVAENLALALPEQTPFFLPRRGLSSAALAAAERLGWRLDPHAPVWQLPVGAQQRLEIVKVLAQDPKVLIFDEPTAVLAPVELEELFAVMQRLRAEGRSLVFISHKLNEVLRLADRITILRRGRTAGTVPASETDAADLARRMVGPVDPHAHAPAHTHAPTPGTGPSHHGAPSDEQDNLQPSTCNLQPSTLNLQPSTFNPQSSTGIPVLRVADLRVRDDRGLEAVRGLSLEVRAGEILGIAGVDGNGQGELAECLLGLRPLSGGRIGLSEQDAADGLPRVEVGYIPQDRKRSGLAPGLSVRDNLVLELHQSPEAGRGLWLRWGWLEGRAAELLRRFDVRASGLDQPVQTLSGGNQQKIVVARALEKDPRLLLALNPTRGVDVAATAFVHDRLREQRDRGAAILLISTELEEVLSLSDRVGVIYEGRLMGIVPPQTKQAAPATGKRCQNNERENRSTASGPFLPACRRRAGIPRAVPGKSGGSSPL
jgi:general nucleoside transport system ATP-binding protein